MKHGAVYTLLCLTLLTASAYAGDAKPPREHPVNKQLRKIIKQIDEKTFGGKSDDLKKLKALRKSASTDALKLKAAAFLGRYYLQLESNPAKAIETVLPFAVNRNAAKEWVKTNKDSYKAAEETYKIKLKAAKKTKLDRKAYPEKPSKKNVYSALPDLKEWTINQKTARAAIVIAYAYMQMKEYPAAMEILRKSGEGTTDLVRILANEGAGDLFFAMKKLEKSVEFYEFAMKYVRQTQKNLDDYGVKRETEVSHFSEDDYYKFRIQRKLDITIKMLEEEKFGADYVLYKRAQKYRLIERDYASSFYAYRDLIAQFPNTIWSEAAEAYRIKTLIILSTMKPTRSVKLSQRTEKLKIDIRSMSIQLKIMEAKKIDKDIISEMKKLIASYKDDLAELKKIPFGAKALVQAEKQAKNFLADNEFGLYRAEVMLDLAYHFLIYSYDMRKARATLKKLVGWLENVRQVDINLANFNVPSKAQRVSQPPPQMKEMDEWGNIRWSEAGTGDLVNRKTAPWILDRITCDAHGLSGVVKLFDGKFGEARKHANVILKYDKFAERFHNAGQPNTYKRLSDAFSRGRIIAGKKTLTGVKPRTRVKLLVAEYLYEKESLPESASIYADLYSQRKKLPRRTQAYVIVMYARCCQFNKLAGDDRALAILKEIDKDPAFQATPFWGQAKFLQASIASRQADGSRNAEAILRDMMTKTTDKHLRAIAMYHTAQLLLASKQYVRSLSLFRRFIDVYRKKEPRHVGAAYKFVEYLEQRLNKAQGEKK